MLVLLGIGFLAGVVTAISPCVLPVLPVILAGGVTGDRRRPFAIVAGLVASFAVFTLFAAWLLDLVGLPQDTLRNVAIGLLFLIAASLLVPRVRELLERPFLPLTRRQGGNLGGGFLLGTSLGLVFVPCAGPVLAEISVLVAHEDFGFRTLALMVAYSLGAGVPMLAIAIGGRELAARLRSQAQRLRIAAGVLIAATAVGLTLHVEDRLQGVPGYAGFLQDKIERSAAAERELGGSTPEARVVSAAEAGSGLPDYGPAPEFTGISRWLNTQGGRPLTMRELRGKVVLIDFWTYTCINCLRTLPHVEAWDAAYRSQGLAVVGIHTPEFAFEQVPANVGAAIRRLHVRHPVALDNDYGTWDAYSNRYWPAKYLVDRRGHVRYFHFGEGSYEETEALIRRLLAAEGAGARPVADTTPQEAVTPESYLGFERLARYAGTPVEPNKAKTYTLPPRLGPDNLAYGGTWRVEGERIVAGKAARLRIHFHARNVYLVLSGKGSVEVLVGGTRERTIAVRANRLYTLRSAGHADDDVMELRFSPGVAAYAFTFG
jgi:cytochrome c biogenesis protein CcdA/thiol-disulfide isomerase/thioredoxin